MRVVGYNIKMDHDFLHVILTSDSSNLSIIRRYITRDTVNVDLSIFFTHTCRVFLTCLQLLVGVLSTTTTLLLGWWPSSLLEVPVTVCSCRPSVNLLGLRLELGLRRWVGLPHEEQPLRARGRCHCVAAHYVFLIVLIYSGWPKPLWRCAPNTRKSRHGELLDRRSASLSLALEEAALSLLALFDRHALCKREKYCDKQHKQLHPATNYCKITCLHL